MRIIDDPLVLADGFYYEGNTREAVMNAANDPNRRPVLIKNDRLESSGDFIDKWRFYIYAPKMALESVIRAALPELPEETKIQAVDGHILAILPGTVHRVKIKMEFSCKNNSTT